MSIRIFLLALVVMGNLLTPASAYIENERGDGAFVVYLIVMLPFLMAALAYGAALSSRPRSYTTVTLPTVTLPKEISTPETVEYYEEHTARARALKSKLDAETELAESYINAMRTKGELDELSEILGHDKTKRITARDGRA